MSEKQVDFLIVGGGTAGCVLARRLTEDPENRVMMLEAGRKDYIWDLLIHMPAALTMPIGNKHYDWCYHSEPEPYMHGRQVFHGRGKVLGGSSSINGMIFQRGNPLDYEKWAGDAGMEKWDYAHCLPYFIKMENCLGSGPPYRGNQGPLHLERGPGANPLFKAFLQATEQAGHYRTEDVNGYRQDGFSLFDRNIKKGKRYSAARAYYHPVKKRENLELLTSVLTTKILFEGNKAVGVEYVQNGQTQKIYAKEVILCAGAFNTPQLLQLSGVGDKEHLENLGIGPVRDLPGVGENLQDHLEVYVQYACQKPVSMNPAMKWYRKPDVGLRWLFGKKGPAATNHFEAGGFIRSNESYDYPNLMFHFLPLAVRYDGTAPAGGHGYQVHVGPMYSTSRGTVKIDSTEIKKYPRVKFNYLSTKEDEDEWVEAIGHARNILKQPALEEFNGGEINPGPQVQEREDILNWVRKDAETAYHPSCTCKMGIDEKSVLDPNTLKVHGLENLRVVDASAFPYIPNGNIMAPVVMLAEKASDLILGNTPLDPLELDYFKARGN